jgi:hypothetical protein
VGLLHDGTAWPLALVMRNFNSAFKKIISAQ